MLSVRTPISSVSETFITARSTALTPPNFEAVDARMQWYVDLGILSCVATTVLDGTDVIHEALHGYMDVDTHGPLTDDAIFRIYSNTKIITSIALMMLHEQGRFDLDDPVEHHIPAFADMSVLNSAATSIDDHRPATRQMTVRHLLSHSAGLSYGFLDPESLIDSTYTERGLTLAAVRSITLEELCIRLGELPLCNDPGTIWQYSFATDVCARLIEVLSGQRFDDFLDQHLFQPLGMVDSGFTVPEDKLGRLTSMYAPTNPLAPMEPGLTVIDHPNFTQYRAERSFLSGGAGLVSTMADYTGFVQMIVNGGTWNGSEIVNEATLALMRTNQLPAGVEVNLQRWPMTDTVFGLGFALKKAPARGEPQSATGEYHWGGMAGTHSWMAPEAGIAGLCFTQRMPGFWHPFSHDFKRLTYEAVTG